MTQIFLDKNPIVELIRIGGADLLIEVTQQYSTVIITPELISEVAKEDVHVQSAFSAWRNSLDPGRERLTIALNDNEIRKYDPYDKGGALKTENFDPADASIRKYIDKSNNPSAITVVAHDSQLLTDQSTNNRGSSTTIIDKPYNPATTETVLNELALQKKLTPAQVATWQANKNFMDQISPSFHVDEDWSNYQAYYESDAKPGESFTHAGTEHNPVGLKAKAWGLGFDVAKKAGIAGAALAFGVTAADAAEFYSNGDTQGGNRIWAEYLVDGGIGLAAGGLVALALVGAPAAVVLLAGVGVGVAVGVATSGLGGQLYDAFPDEFDALFEFGRDFVDDIALSPLGVLSLSGPLGLGAAVTAGFFSSDGPVFGDNGLLDENGPFANLVDQGVLLQALQHVGAASALGPLAPAYLSLQALLYTFENPPASPLVLDLDSDGVELTSVDGATAFFDVDVNGFAEATGWVAADDGLLALDVNGNGIIDDGSELFGDQTGYSNGFLALAAHDSNSDGKIDASDTIFTDLVVWQDLNSDGISQTSELRSVTDVGIASISLGTTSWDSQAGDDLAGNDTKTPIEGTFEWSDGSTGRVLDVFFEGDPIRTVAKLPDGFEYHPDVFKLPVLAGAGSLASTWVAQSEDAALRQRAVDLVAQAVSGDMLGFYDGFIEYLYAWAGVEDSTRWGGQHIEGRTMAFLEVVFNQSFTHWDGRPEHWAAQRLDDGFADVAGAMAGQFLSQVAVSDALLSSVDAASYAARLDTSTLVGLSPEGDPAEVAAAILAQVEAGGIGALDAGIALHLTALARPNGGALLDAAEVAAASLGADAQGAAVFARSIDHGKLRAGTAGDDMLDSSEDFGRSILVGGAGNDMLTGGRWDATTYVYRAGDGSDTIDEGNGSGSGGDDRLLIDGFGLSDVRFQHSSSGANSNLVIALADGQTITLVDQFGGTDYEIEEIVLGDGTVIDTRGARAKLIEDQKVAGADTVVGTSRDDDYVYRDGDGSFVIQEVRSSPYDRLFFEDHLVDDVAFLHTGFSTFSDGDLTLRIGTETITIRDHVDNYRLEIDEMVFSDGTVLRESDMRVRMLHDMKATGLVRGTEGSDDHFHTTGDGSYEIHNFSRWGRDELTFTDLLANEVRFSVSAANSEDLVITTTTGEQLVIQKQLHSTNDERRIEEFIFSDDVQLDHAAVLGRLSDDADRVFFFGGSGNETVNGGIDADRLVGAGGDDNLGGGGANDVLSGEDGNDFLAGEDGDDLLVGGSGSDVLEGGTGTDVLDGGDGDDLIFANTAGSIGNGNDALIGGAGNDSLVGANGNNLLDGGDGNDTLDGGDDWTTSDRDTLIGGEGNDSLRSGQVTTPNSLTPGDWLQGDAGNDTLEGGLANDTLEGGANNDLLSGGGGHDTLWASADGLNKYGRDTMHGGDGNDLLEGANGRQLMYGDAGNDTLTGGWDSSTADADTMYGGDGDDLLQSEQGSTGNPEDGDLLYGEAGSDTLEGGSANDLLVGGASTDSLVGGGGNDSLYAGSETSAVAGRDSLFGEAGDDLLVGTNGKNLLDGGDGNDTLDGGDDWKTADVDTLIGGDGDDLLRSGQNDVPRPDNQGKGDRMFGGAGADTLESGLANDRMEGGADADRFVFSDAFGDDVITDFSLAESDVIDLSAITGLTGIGNVTFDTMGGTTTLTFDLDNDGLVENGLSITLDGTTLTAADTAAFVF